MPSESEKRAIEQKIYQLNSLLAEIRQFRIEHPETRVGHYVNSVGSLLNAYREGDIGFDECVVAIKAAAAPSPVAAEHMTMDNDALELAIRFIGSGVNIEERRERLAAGIIIYGETRFNAGLEAAAEVIADFDDWIWCDCPECRVDAGSHAVKTQASLTRIATAIRALKK